MAKQKDNRSEVHILWNSTSCLITTSGFKISKDDEAVQIYKEMKSKKKSKLEIVTYGTLYLFMYCILFSQLFQVMFKTLCFK